MAFVQRSGAPQPRATLERRLQVLMDLCLRLKDLSWAVSGPAHLAEHQLLEPQMTGVSSMVDASAARLGMLEGSGLDPDHDEAAWMLERQPRPPAWRADGPVAELRSLSAAYRVVIAGHAEALSRLGADAVTRRLLQGQSDALGRYDRLLADHLGLLA